MNIILVLRDKRVIYDTSTYLFLIFGILGTRKYIS